jgi:transposase
MAYREVTMFEIKEALRLWMLGVAKKRIAAMLGLDPKTVRRYIEVAESCSVARDGGIEQLTDERVAEVVALIKTAPGRERGRAWYACEAEREFIRGMLEGHVRLSKIRRLLRRRGIVIPYSTLHRFAVAELDFGRGRTTVAIVDGVPGEELQVDTGWMTLLEPDAKGHRRKFKAFIFTPSVSRYRFVYAVKRETTQSAIEACEAAWRFYGGVFRVLIPDNLKAIIQTADPLEPKITQDFLEYAQTRGFVVDATRVRRPTDKARVERGVRDVRDDCFGGETIIDIGGANQRAVYWCREEYGMRRHSTTYRLPREHFEAEELQRLLPAPEAPYDIPLWADPKVGRDHFAQVARALYSLPTRYIGRKLRARADSKLVRFYDQGRFVKVHERQPRGGRATDPNDFPDEKRAYAMRDVDFLMRKAHGHGKHVGAFAHAVLAGPLPWTRMRRVYALLGLVRRYGDERVDEACARALDHDMLSVHRLSKMLASAAPPPEPRALATVVPIGRYLRPKEQFAIKKGDPK